MTEKQKRYEEFAYVLDFLPEGKSAVIKGRKGSILQALGEDRLTLLELLAVDNMNFDIGEKLRIGREGRDKIQNVMGKLSYNELTRSAARALPFAIRRIAATRADFNEVYREGSFGAQSPVEAISELLLDYVRKSGKSGGTITAGHLLSLLQQRALAKTFRPGAIEWVEMNG